MVTDVVRALAPPGAAAGGATEPESGATTKTEAAAPSAASDSVSENLSGSSPADAVEGAVSEAAAATTAAAVGEAIRAPDGEGGAAQSGAASEEAPPEPSPRAAVAPAAAAVGRRASAAATHQPEGNATGSAIAASNRPEVTQRRNAEGVRINAADAAETGEVNQNSFEAALRAAIARAMPDASNESDARDVMKTGASSARDQLQVTMGEQQTAAVGNLPGAVSEEAPAGPPPSGGEEVELVPEAVGPAPEGVSAGPVVPPPSTPAAVNTSANRDGADSLAAENNITDRQLASGNDPQFQATLGARDEAETHDREAPAALREAEASDRQNTQGRAAGAIAGGLTDFHTTRTAQMGDVATQQTTTQSDTERRKQEITEDIEAIGLAVRTDVTRILREMDEGAAELFNTAIEDAMQDYDAAFAEEKGGLLTSVGDFLTGDWGDERFNRALALGRRAFEARVETAITDIAAFVERKLTEARDRITEGRTEIETYMTENVSEAERELAETAATAITADFDALETEVSDRRDALVDNMVDIYRQGIERRNAREEQLQEENKSFWQRVYDATVGVIQKVIEFKNMLLGILSRAAAVVEAIIQDPIGFLRNLIAGIGAGLERFVSNIGENLKNALMGWLFGALEGAGIKLPDKFDLKGFLDVVLQVLGLTKENVRARAVGILGEDMVAKIEGAVDFLRILFTEGPAGIWQMLLEKLSTIKDVIIDEIKSWVITKIVEAGIKWIIGLLNPAGAFVKACMMIYDIVIFFIERGQQIIAAVNAIINALGTIVAGNIGAMAAAVEGALNRILPVVISFLASLLGLGGISEKIRGFIEKVQEPVNKAIDWVINLGVGMARRIAGLLGGKEDDNVEEDADDPEKELKLQRAREDLLVFEAEQGDGGGVDLAEAEATAAKLKQNHPVISGIRVEAQDDHWLYHISASASRATPGQERRVAGFTENQIVRAKDRAVTIVKGDLQLRSDFNAKVSDYDEQLQDSSQRIVVASREDQIALGIATERRIASSGARGVPGSRRPYQIGAGNVSVTNRRFGPTRPNPVIHDERSRAPGYPEMQVAIATAARSLGMNRGQLETVMAYWRRNLSLPPGYAGQAAAADLERELRSLEAIRMISERQRGQTSMASTAMGEFEMQQAALADPEGEVTPLILMPVTTGQPEAVPGGSAALRGAEDRARGDTLRDHRVANPTSERGRNRQQQFDNAAEHHATASLRQVTVLLESDRGNSISNEDDLVNEFIAIIRQMMLR